VKNPVSVGKSLLNGPGFLRFSSPFRRPVLTGDPDVSEQLCGRSDHPVWPWG
jgi:hypothetical protein